MKILSASDVRIRMMEDLGLDPKAFDLLSVETIACALRRTAGFLCPCPPSRLINTTMESFTGLVDDKTRLAEVVEETLEALTAHGDLLEINGSSHADDKSALIYAAPPSFIKRQSGLVLLLGVTPDHTSPLPEHLEQRIEHVNHLRRLSVETDEDLSQYGLIELSLNHWGKVPPPETAAQYLGRVGKMLDSAPPSGDIPGLTLLDPTRPTRYYKGRWVKISNQTGRFIARRPQAYGSDLWCYVQIENGIPQKFVDFPLDKERNRGCDEAWRLQAAIDSVRGEPQQFRVRQGPGGTHEVDFFSPVPMWVRRRLDTVGEPTVSSGCLFSYRIKADEIEEETRFLKGHAWFTELR